MLLKIECSCGYKLNKRVAAHCAREVCVLVRKAHEKKGCSARVVMTSGGVRRFGRMFFAGLDDELGRMR